MNSFKKSWVILTSTLLLCLATMSMYFFHSLEDVKNLKDLENPPLKKEKILAQAFNFPLYFEKNEGQTDENVRYLTKGKGYKFYFTPGSVVISLEKALNEDQSCLTALSMKFVGAKQDPLIKGIEEQIYKTNYFIGNEPSNWHANVPTFEKVCYEELYPGIDAIFYGNKHQLEYDLCVAPRSNPEEICLHMEGMQKLSLDSAGNLHIHVEDDQEMLMQKPIVYQIKEGEKVFLEGNFVLLAHNEVGFALGEYDKAKELIIDPVLAYSTYLGGSNIDSTAGIAVDSSGNAYVTGRTNSTNFPTTVGAFRTFYNGGANDVFVTKMNSAGSGLLYSTYLGGSADDEATGIAINSNGDASVVGFTKSTNFPVTAGAFQTSIQASGFNAFVTKLDPSGSFLLFSTYLGGSDDDSADAVAVDSSQNTYVTGSASSTNFPTTAGVFQSALNGIQDVFLAKFDLAGNLLYSTYLGGSNTEEGLGIAVDSSESVYLTGETSSSNFPTTSGAFQTSFPSILGGPNAFVTKFNSAATGLVYSTYLGGNFSDQGNSIALDTANHAYLTGFTISSNFPTTPGAFQPTKPVPGVYAFVTQLNAAGSALIYSTYLNGTVSTSGGLNTIASSIAVNSTGNAFVTGGTTATDFPTTVGAFQSTFLGNTGDAFITEFNPTGTGLIYSTFFGAGSDGTGIAFGSDNSFYITGGVSTTSLPTTTGAFQTALSGINNSFIAKFQIGAIPIITGLSPNFGPTAGGTIVTITGANFFSITSVDFGGVPAAGFIVDSSTQITAISPPGTGTVDVRVSNANGTSVITPADEFTYIQGKQPTTTTLTIVPNPAGQPVTLVANVAPSAATGTVTFFDGSNPIGTVSLVNGTASLTISLPVGTLSISAVYSGDANFFPSSSSSLILVIASSTPCTPCPPCPPAPPPTESVFPPTKLKGNQKVNEFATQISIANILNWKPPIEGNPPATYRIYRNQALTELIGVVPAYDKLQFVDNNRKPGKTYTYWVVSVDSFGNISKPTTVTVKKR